MPQITSQMVKELRERTQAGMMDCKKALQATDGDMEKAIDFLREKGLAAAAKKAGRVASEGLIEAYVHMGGRLGVLVEVNCETDFVANTDEFKQFAHDIAMHIAAAKPLYVRREEVPQDVIDHERRIYAAAAKQEGKPENIIDRIVDGRIEKYFQEVCLLEQPFVRDPDTKISQLLQEKIAKLGENMQIRRFVRFERGEGIDKQSPEEAE